MKKIKLKKANKDVVDGWMGTYGDMVTLLMAFFVMLFAISDPDPRRLEEISKAMKEEFSNIEIHNEFKALHENLTDIIEKRNLDHKVEIKRVPTGILIQIPGNSLFLSGSAEVRDDMSPVIEKISNTITDLLDESTYKDYMIEVEGHTDDEPITEDSKQFNSNWDLSAMRATGIVELLVASGIEMDKLKVIARGESNPLLPNRDAGGKPIAENRAMNRRVEINIKKYN